MSVRVNVLVYVAAGLVFPLLWTFIENNMIGWLPLPTSKLMWRSIQAFVGSASAALLVGPLVLAIRPTSPYRWVPFVGCFVAFEVILMLAIGQLESLILMFQLPDIWAFLATSIVLIVWASTHSVASRAA
jgi:hypothetical protein